MKKYQIVRDYISYYVRAKTKHGIHSPFVYEFVTKVIEQKPGRNELLDNIEKLRNELLLSSKKINTVDFGAGKDGSPFRLRNVRDIVKNAAKRKKYADILYKIVEHYRIQTILELGTSAGISSMYLAASSFKNKVITMEGCPETSKLAKENFDRLHFSNIRQITGNFDETLPGALKMYAPFDCVCFDGNHRQKATLRYFEQCLPYIHNNSIFIFDDINWSIDMKNAWHIIQSHPSVMVSIDLFFLGIVFFRKELSKENFVIRF